MNSIQVVMIILKLFILFCGGDKSNEMCVSQDLKEPVWFEEDYMVTPKNWKLYILETLQFNIAAGG